MIAEDNCSIVCPVSERFGNKYLPITEMNSRCNPIPEVTERKEFGPTSASDVASLSISWRGNDLYLTFG